MTSAPSFSIKNSFASVPFVPSVNFDTSYFYSGPTGTTGPYGCVLYSAQIPVTIGNDYNDSTAIFCADLTTRAYKDYQCWTGSWACSGCNVYPDIHDPRNIDNAYTTPGLGLNVTKIITAWESTGPPQPRVEVPFGFIGELTVNGQPTRNYFLTYRGTQNDTEGFIDELALQFDAPWAPGAGVHVGWLSLYTSGGPAGNQPALSIQGQVRAWVAANGAHVDRLYITGHSLGASIANITVSDLVTTMTGALAPSKIVTYTFGSPRTGNPGFVNTISGTDTVLWNIINLEDVFPTITPPPVLYLPTAPLIYYAHVPNILAFSENWAYTGATYGDAILANHLPGTYELGAVTINNYLTHMQGKY